MKRTYHFIRWMICTLLLCAFVNSVYADRVVYTYDSSGNRTRARKEIVLRSEGSQEEDSLPQRQNLSLRHVTIYPNPTKGRLRVEITGGGSFEGASLTVYSISGSIVCNLSELDAVNDIDLSQCPNGMYMLVIRVDGESSSWKIIKI